MNRKSFLQRKTALKRSKERSLRRAQGKKYRENAKVNREKKAEHLRSGIMSCELRLPGCTPFLDTSWSHSRKRRKMGKWASEQRAINMRHSVLACWACHQKAEGLPPEELLQLHVEAIAMRDERKLEAA